MYVCPCWRVRKRVSDSERESERRRSRERERERVSNYLWTVYVTVAASKFVQTLLDRENDPKPIERHLSIFLTSSNLDGNLNLTDSFAFKWITTKLVMTLAVMSSGQIVKK